MFRLSLRLKVGGYTHRMFFLRYAPGLLSPFLCHTQNRPLFFRFGSFLAHFLMVMLEKCSKSHNLEGEVVRLEEDSSNENTKLGLNPSSHLLRVSRMISFDPKRKNVNHLVSTQINQGKKYFRLPRYAFNCIANQ